MVQRSRFTRMLSLDSPPSALHASPWPGTGRYDIGGLEMSLVAGRGPQVPTSEVAVRAQELANGVGDLEFSHALEALAQNVLSKS